jgi:hypothetical protein
MDYSANHLLALKQYPRFYKIKRWCFTLQNSEFNLTNRYIQYSNETKESLPKRTRLYIRYFWIRYLLPFMATKQNRPNYLKLLNNALEHTETGFVKLRYEATIAHK